jgi:hypothetical protein
MILPTKGILPRHALVALGADILRQLSEAKTVSRLWEDFRKTRTSVIDVSFDWFVLSLDLLFVIGVVEFERGRVRKVELTAKREVSS